MATKAIFDPYFRNIMVAKNLQILRYLLMKDLSKIKKLRRFENRNIAIKSFDLNKVEG